MIPPWLHILIKNHLQRWRRKVWLSWTLCWLLSYLSGLFVVFGCSIVNLVIVDCELWTSVIISRNIPWTVYYNCVTYTHAVTQLFNSVPIIFCSYTWIVLESSLSVADQTLPTFESWKRVIDRLEWSSFARNRVSSQINYLQTDQVSSVKCYKCRVNNTVILRYTRGFAGKSQWVLLSC